LYEVESATSYINTNPLVGIFSYPCATDILLYYKYY
jgi:hypothetical protein